MNKIYPNPQFKEVIRQMFEEQLPENMKVGDEDVIQEIALTAQYFLEELTARSLTMHKYDTPLGSPSRKKRYAIKEHYIDILTRGMHIYELRAETRKRIHAQLNIE